MPPDSHSVTSRLQCSLSPSYHLAHNFTQGKQLHNMITCNSAVVNLPVRLSGCQFKACGLPAKIVSECFQLSGFQVAQLFATNGQILFSHVYKYSNAMYRGVHCM